MTKAKHPSHTWIERFVTSTGSVSTVRRLEHTQPAKKFQPTKNIESISRGGEKILRMNTFNGSNCDTREPSLLFQYKLYFHCFFNVHVSTATNGPRPPQIFNFVSHSFRVFRTACGNASLLYLKQNER